MNVASKLDEVPFAVRNAEEGDVAYVISAWTRGQRAVGDNRDMEAETYFRQMRDLIASRLSFGECKLAVNIEDPWQIFGFVCYDEHPVVIHYVYVKHTFRRLGIGRRLLELATNGKRPVTVTTKGMLYDDVKARYGLQYSRFL